MPDIRLEVGGARIRTVHGSPRRMNEYLSADRDPQSLARIARIADCDVLVFGHTHKPRVKQIEGVLMVNAGKPKDGDPRAAWALLTIDGERMIDVKIKRVSYPLEAMANAICSAEGLPDQFAVDIETGGNG